ncbi:MAG: DUF2202 domain-containing protein [Burkholderiaceae bacterium]
MSLNRKAFLLRLAALTGVGMTGGLLGACGGGSDDAPALSAVDATGLSAEELEGLQFMREEEKLAHDVYLTLYGRWNHTVFRNIADSESTHTEAVRQLLEAYGADDPAAGQPVGRFTNDSLQQLYSQLVARGQVSLIEALKVGCLIEEKDIADIAAELAQLEGEPAITRVYENLMCGSRNHLRAFSTALLAQGGSYTPSYLDQAQWDQIAGAATEACGR